MFCTKCGNEIDNSAVFCTKCGAQVRIAQGAVKNEEVKSHMVGAILQTIVCIPAGVVPLIYACKVNSKLAKGDIIGAQEDSKKAKFWINVGTAIVGAIIILSMIVNASSNTSSNYIEDDTDAYSMNVNASFNV